MKKAPTLAELRRAVADYIGSEGCSCCEDTYAHDAARARLGRLLRVVRHKGNLGYDFTRYRTPADQL